MNTEAASAITEAGAAVGGLSAVHLSYVFTACFAVLLVGSIMLICYGFPRFGWVGLIPTLRDSVGNVGTQNEKQWELFRAETKAQWAEHRAEQKENQKLVMGLIDQIRKEQEDRSAADKADLRREIDQLREDLRVATRGVEIAPPTSRSPQLHPAPRSARSP